MSGRSRARAVRGIVGGAAGLLAAGAAAGYVVERRRAHERRDARGTERDPLGSLHGATRRLRTEDGVELHVEVDEPDADLEQQGSGLTVVFVHGYALNHDCWHFQRKALRGRHRLVFYDQRSHGRSSRSDSRHSTLDQLGHDLRTVLDAVAPQGPVVLVGHSMGGMSVMALAEQAPDLFGDRVVGVGLLATSAGDLGGVTLGLPGWPGRLVHRLAPGALAMLARASVVAESGRRAGGDVAYALTQRYAFGGEVGPEVAEFTDEMLAATPIGVLSAFFPVFGEHNRYAALAPLRRVDVLVLGGTADQMTPVAHSREIAQRLPSAELRELEGAGHMLMLERPEDVNRALVGLLEQVRAEAVA